MLDAFGVSPFDLSAFLCHLTLQLNPLVHCGLYGLQTFHDLHWQLCETEEDKELRRKV